jgi:hypothetical protein
MRSPGSDVIELQWHGIGPSRPQRSRIRDHTAGDRNALAPAHSGSPSSDTRGVRHKAVTLICFTWVRGEDTSIRPLPVIVTEPAHPGQQRVSFPPLFRRPFDPGATHQSSDGRVDSWTAPPSTPATIPAKGEPAARPYVYDPGGGPEPSPPGRPNTLANSPNGTSTRRGLCPQAPPARAAPSRPAGEWPGFAFSRVAYADHPGWPGGRDPQDRAGGERRRQRVQLDAS